MFTGPGRGEPLSLHEALDRLLEDGVLRRESVSPRAMGDSQSMPVNIFQTAERVVVYAPMPGLHPEDVEITVHGNLLRLRSVRRGHEERHELVRQEWTVGPYHRDVSLPEDVNAQTARATLDNGVVVVVFDRSGGDRPRRIPVRPSKPEEVNK